MSKKAILGLALLPVLLTGCLESAYRAGAPVRESGQSPVQSVSKRAPVPVRQRSEPATPQAADDKEVQIAVYTPPPRFRPKPVASAAVSGLVETAERQKRSGDMTGAAATMERALRIEPRNAHLWNQLAEVRLEQGQFAQAEDLASKSNALAAADRDLRRNNWLLIAKARRSVGNSAGARLAENKANFSR